MPLRLAAWSLAHKRHVQVAETSSCITDRWLWDLFTMMEQGGHLEMVCEQTLGWTAAQVGGAGLVGTRRLERGFLPKPPKGILRQYATAQPFDVSILIRRFENPIKRHEMRRDTPWVSEGRPCESSDRRRPCARPRREKVNNFNSKYCLWCYHVSVTPELMSMI